MKQIAKALFWIIVVVGATAFIISRWMRRSRLKLKEVDFTTGNIKFKSPLGEFTENISAFEISGDHVLMFNKDFELGIRHLPNEQMEVYLVHLDPDTPIKNEAWKIDFLNKTTTYFKLT